MKDIDRATTTDILETSFSDIHSASTTILDTDIAFQELNEECFSSSTSFDITQVADILLDNINDYIFITDSLSRKIVFINKPMQDALGLNGPFADTCYHLLFGRTSPCVNCKGTHPLSNTFYVTSLVNQKFKQKYAIKTRKVVLYNRSFNINFVLRGKPVINELNQAQSFYDLIGPYASIYANHVRSPELQLFRIIEKFGQELGADLAALYERVDQTENSSSVAEKNHQSYRSHIWVADDAELDYEKCGQTFINIEKDISSCNHFLDNEYSDENGNLIYPLPLFLEHQYLGTLFILNPKAEKLKQLKPAFVDISKFLAGAIDRRKMKSEILNIASRDTLTGLKNRTALLNDINILSITNNLGIIYLNVNGLKSINSEFGLSKGDAILKKLASLLRQLIHNNDYIYRLGGDEFLAIQTSVTEQNFSALTDMIKAFMSSDRGFSSSVGSTWIQSGMEIFSAISLAETDMYKEKKKYYRNHDTSEIARYRSANDKINTILEPERIKELIATDCFKVFYQPKFDIQNGEPRIGSAEALIRLFINDKMIPPDDFIPALEQAHFTYLIDYYVLEHICKTMRERMEQGLKVVPVSCNFSRHTIVKPDFIETVKNIMNKYDISFNMIPFEVSEHTNTDRHKELVDVTESLANEGFCISIDDFGTAHGNIYTLADLPVTELKFDKKLIDNIAITNNNKLVAIIRVLISMCKSLGIKTVAEGVEDQSQNDILKHLGCDTIQGYFYSRPLSETDYYSRVY